MPTIETLSFELERRVILFKPTTTMPDGSQLGFDGDPNDAQNGSTDGESLIYNCPFGSRYEESSGRQWFKKSMPNTWERFGQDILNDAQSIAARTDHKEYSIAASTAMKPREGYLVYLTDVKDTVALAKADSEDTLPVFGIIIKDKNHKADVKSINTIYRDVKVDSSALVMAGDRIFVSDTEAGMATSFAPTEEGSVVQFIGTSDENESEGRINVQFQPGPTIKL